MELNRFDTERVKKQNRPKREGGQESGAVKAERVSGGRGGNSNKLRIFQGVDLRSMFERQKTGMAFLLRN
jgi:hypothetical protein